MAAELGCVQRSVTGPAAVSFREPPLEASSRRLPPSLVCKRRATFAAAVRKAPHAARFSFSTPPLEAFSSSSATQGGQHQQRTQQRQQLRAGLRDAIGSSSLCLTHSSAFTRAVATPAAQIQRQRCRLQLCRHSPARAHGQALTADSKDPTASASNPTPSGLAVENSLGAPSLEGPASAGSAAPPLTIIPSTSAPAAAPVAKWAPETHIRVPQSIRDISNGDHILGFGAQLAEDHPGFHDEEYKRRRSELADLAKTHVIGQPIPSVDYSESEVEVWRQVLSRLSPLYPTHACSHFLRSFPRFQFSPNRIPQLQELSEILLETTGWQIRPVAGLLHPRDFLNGLAFRYFHSTQYIRHGSQPMYTPEPDICHELLGHVPMLADPEFAGLAQAIGEASLGASEKEIWHLTKLYWYTVEFGTILEDNEIKAFGAGILSSFGELAYMRDGAVSKDGVFQMPQFVELDPFAKLPKMSYKDGFQRTYFLCNSFHDVAEKLHSYAAAVKKTNLVPAPQHS